MIFFSCATDCNGHLTVHCTTEHPNTPTRVEKYRPGRLEDLISHGDILATSTFILPLHSNTSAILDVDLGQRNMLTSVELIHSTHTFCSPLVSVPTRTHHTSLHRCLRSSAIHRRGSIATLAPVWAAGYRQDVHHQGKSACPPQHVGLCKGACWSCVRARKGSH